MKHTLLPLLLLLGIAAKAQDRMTPELLWGLHRVSGTDVSRDGRYLYYSSKTVDIKTEKSTSIQYRINLVDGARKEWTTDGAKTICQRYENAWYAYNDNFLYQSVDSGNTWHEIFRGLQDAENVWVSPNGKYVAYSKEVLVKPMLGADIYADLPNTTARVYTDLNYRHWDTWEDGKFSHIFVSPIKDGTAKDIMEDEAFDSPTKPFGGSEDLAWSPDSKGLVYVCKKKFGKDYAQSTNTDLYYYNIATGKTDNWTEGMPGYDMQPAFSKDGKNIAWLSMSRDGYEADKNDIVVMNVESKKKTNITAKWDGTVEGFIWASDNNKLYFTAPYQGTQQLFDVAVPYNDKDKTSVNNITKG